MVHRVGDRSRLYDVIIGGFEYLLRRSSRESQQQSGARVDGREAGYVVWVPRKGQYKQQREAWDEDSQQGGVDDPSSPVVAYGGGYGGLFNGGLEQALASCDCFVPPLHVVRIPLELLPPPSSAHSRCIATAKSSTGGCPIVGSSPHHPIHRSESQSTAGTLSSTRSSSSGTAGRSKHQPRERVQENGIRGVSLVTGHGRKGAKSTPTVRQRRCEAAEILEANSKSEKESPELETGERGKGRESTERRLPQREIVDLWWFTDPPAPKVSAGALRLRVATEMVKVLQTDAEDAPEILCTIEVCQGRPYLPGRLQRYPNMDTSSGSYRSVHSYRVPVRACAGQDRLPVGGAGSTGSLLSSTDPPTSSSWRNIGGGGREGSNTGMAATPEAWVSITDVKPSHWYNVRHRFSWRAEGRGEIFASAEEVVTATRHVHTEAFFPPVTPPPRPYAMLGCSRQHPQHQRSQQKLRCDRRASRPEGGPGEHLELGFHLRLRWGPGPRGTGRHEDPLFFGQGGAPKEKEYVLQVRMLEPSSSRKASRHRGSFDGDSSTDNAHVKKARASSPADYCGGGSSRSFGGSGPDLRSSGTKTPGRGLHARNVYPAANRHNATWSPGRTPGGRYTSTTTATATSDAGDIGSDQPFFENYSKGGDLGAGLEGCQDRRSSEARWGEWTMICKTGKHRETVDLPHVTSSSSGRDGPTAALGLHYRVGVRRRDGEQKFAFSEVLEVPSALLRRLYEIEEIVATRQPLPRATSVSRTTMMAAGCGSSARRLGRDRTYEKGTLGRDEALNLLKAFEMSGDGDSFPTRLAWDLQSEFWPQEDAQEERKPSLVEDEVRLKVEAESIQCTLGFPVNIRFIAGVIREVDASAGG